VPAAALNRSTNASKMSSWTKIRWTLMQTWPAYANEPTVIRLTAQARLAVRSTMTAALPPSSRTTFLRPARAFIGQPTAGDPVKERTAKRSSATSRSPSSRLIGRMLTDPAGAPASSTISATVSIVRGSLEGGLRTMEHPAAIAGASLWAARLSGKLNGLIAATGPAG
jgi:hypothetical protein